MKRLILILCICYLPDYLKSQPLLQANGDVNRIEQNGSYYDGKIPHVASLSGHNYIDFILKGADGGAYKSDINQKKGGGGATVRASFKIGDGPGELRPEGIIRFVVGKRGHTVRANVVAGGGGGGGTAILYKHPDANITCNQVSTNLADAGSCWVLLGVAGGGGGAYLEGRGKGGNAGECGKNGGDGDGGNGGCNGNGGNRGTDGSSTSAGGGGGAFSEGGGGPQGGGGGGRFGGGAGNLTGGVGGVSSSKKDGGFGYGGGGGGGQALALAGGGGGGGYSGGGGGYYSEGGGGGSFANSVAQEVAKEEGGSDGSPDPGHVIYQFVFKDGPTARCKDITVTLVDGSATINAQSIDAGSFAEAGETITGKAIAVESPIIPGLFIFTASHTFPCWQLGDYTVKLFLQSSSGKTAECLSVVEVVDDVAPVVSCTSSVLDVVLDADGQYEFSSAELNAAGTASDACGEVVDRYVGTTFSCAQPGIQTVPLIVEDNSGNTGSCQLTVNVDNGNVTEPNPPVLVCNDVTVTLDANGEATVTAAEIGVNSYDDCTIQSYSGYVLIPSGGQEIQQSFPIIFDNCSPLMTYSAYLTGVVDQSGNETSGSCLANITLLSEDNPNRWYVNGSADKFGRGTSWSCPLQTVQEALYYADAGDEIWVAAGTYYPDEGPGQTDNDTTSRFQLLADVALYGGFAGGENSLVERDWRVNETILSGDLMQNDGPGMTNYEDNADHVVFAGVSSNINTVIDGFTITGGNAATGSGVPVLGGGMFIIRAEPQIANCRFIENMGRNGAAMYIHSESSPAITNCFFGGNQANTAAIAVNQAAPTFINCVITGNGGHYGGIEAVGTSLVSAINCSFSGNVIGLKKADPASVTLTNCIFWGNGTELVGNVSITHSIIRGGYAGTGNLDENPRFIGQPDIGVSKDGDLRILSCSPAIDRGDDSVNNTLFDPAGNARRFDAFPGGTLIDMGAYESQSEAPTHQAICRNRTVYLDETGHAQLSAKSLDGKSSGCGPFTYEVAGEDTLHFTCDDVLISPMQYTLTVTDSRGNSGTCQTNVTVINDYPPVAVCRDAVVYLDSSGDGFVMPEEIGIGSSDACGQVFLQLDRETFNCSDLGVQQVTLTVTNEDAKGSQCVAHVEVVDPIAPTALCKNTTINLDGGGYATLVPETINDASYDNCNTGELVYELSQTSFSCLDLGVQEVVLSVTDNSDHTATCTVTVSVQDPMPPRIQCVTDIQISLDENGQATLLPGDLITSATDNCTPAEELSLGVIYEDENGVYQWEPKVDLNCADQGTQLIGAIATDAFGNYSLPCEINLTVQDDTAPTLTCPENVTADTDPGVCAAYISDLPLPAFSDNCALSPHYETHYVHPGGNGGGGTPPLPGLLEARTFEIGTTTITYYTADPALDPNAVSCNFQVNITDNVPPEAVCRNITLQLDASGTASITDEQLDGGSTDNCGIGGFSARQKLFDCSDLGPNIVALRVNDTAGLNGTCEAVVTVEDPNAYCPDCDATLTLSGDIPAGTHQAATWIESNGQVKTGTDVTFLAGNAIHLRAGFRADAGSRFLARIEDCEATVTETAIAIGSPVTSNNESPVAAMDELKLRVFPNPFTRAFTIQYEILEESEVEAHLISADGRVRQVLLPLQRQTAGTHHLGWDHQELAAGMYIIQLRVGENRHSRKLIKMK